jgi:hypothetical protein
MLGMKNFKFLILALSVIALYGCAHPIQIAPNTANIIRVPNDLPRIKASVGLIIPTEMTNLQVTTPGGGGDNVRYYPYRDMQAAYEAMLANVFENVVRVEPSDNRENLIKSGISLTVTPEVITNSGSTGFFTWPPTNFTVDMTSVVKDTSGRVISNPRVIGNGQAAGFSDFKGDFGIAGRRALEDALKKTQHALLEQRYSAVASSGVVSAMSTSEAVPTITHGTAAVRLDELKGLLKKGLITQDDYDQKKKEVLSHL